MCRYYEVNPPAKLLTDGPATFFSENPCSVLSLCWYYEVNSTTILHCWLVVLGVFLRKPVFDIVSVQVLRGKPYGKIADRWSYDVLLRKSVLGIVFVQVLRGEPYGKTADWWSYGVLLYQMATGMVRPGSDLNQTDSHCLTWFWEGVLSLCKFMEHLDIPHLTQLNGALPVYTFISFVFLFCFYQ